MSRSCSAEYAFVAYRWRNLCSVQVPGKTRRPICETELAAIWPLQRPGNAYCPVVAHRVMIAWARSVVTGTVRVRPPFPGSSQTRVGGGGGASVSG